MSAYGAIPSPARSTDLLPSTIWRLPSKQISQDGRRAEIITIHHINLATALALPGLVQYLHTVFADELERGLTYPQEIRTGETYTQDMFEAYYFAGDVLLAMIGCGSAKMTEFVDGSELLPRSSIERVRQEREWGDCVAGCYYVSLVDSFVRPFLL